jgi:hypothetical protein
MLLIPFNTLAESEKIMKFCSESNFSMISSVSAIASAAAVGVGAYLRYPEFHATAIFYIYRCESCELLTISERSVAKYLVLIFSWIFFNSS